MSNLKLEVGKTYLNRLGATVTVLECIEDPTFPYVDTEGLSYREDGGYYKEGESSRDLIEEVESLTVEEIIPYVECSDLQSDVSCNVVLKLRQLDAVEKQSVELQAQIENLLDQLDRERKARNDVVDIPRADGIKIAELEAALAKQQEPDVYNRKLRIQLEQEWVELRKLREAEKAAQQQEFVPIPLENSQEAEVAILAMLAEYQHPSNMMNAARAGWRAARLFESVRPMPTQQQSTIPAAWTDLTAYILQDDLHNRLTPRVVDIAYSAWTLGRQGKNKYDGGPCDWFNDTKPMVMEQLAKIRKDLAEQDAVKKKVSN